MSKNCPHCGKELPEEAAFCLFCCNSIKEMPVKDSRISAKRFKTSKKKCHSDSSADRRDTDEKSFRLTALPKKLPNSAKHIKPIAVAAFSIILAALLISLFISTAKSSANQSLKAPDKDLPVIGTTPDKVNNGFNKSEADSLLETIEAETQKQSFFEKLFHITKENTSEPSLPQKPSAATTKAVTGTLPAEKTEPHSNKINQPENTVQTTAPENTQAFSSDGIKYENINNKLKITGYTGSSANVLVPAYVDGLPVTYIGSDAFVNNENIKSITFESKSGSSDRTLYFPTDSYTAFKNLPNVTEITLPYETSIYRYQSDYSMKYSDCALYYAFSGLPKLRNVFVSDRNGESSSGYLSESDGVLFQKGTLIFYPPAKSNAVYTIPSFVTDVESDSFSGCLYLQEVHFGTTCTYFSAEFKGCTNLKNIYADGRSLENGDKYFSQDGVLFYKSNSTMDNMSVIQLKCYPAGRKSTVYSLPELPNGYMYQISTGMQNNPYITKLYCPVNTYIWPHLATGFRPASLCEVYMKSGDKYTEQALKNTGITNTLDIITY